MLCPSCGHENPAESRFCNSCGQPLSGEAQRPDVPAHLAEKIRASRGALEGERKQVTVLFADVMGSMELAEQTDPETWRSIMDRFFAILSEGIHRFEGTVDKFTGDGIMAIFGAPIAHEDHARRACVAAYAMTHRLAEYGAELRRTHGINFSVRIGLNSGEVVVGRIGDDLDMSYTAVGHTVGLAQRMEQLAEPGHAYLTEHTAALAEGYIEMRDLGEFEVKGTSRKLRVFDLEGVGSGKGRLDVSRARGFSRFVGREKEIAALEEALERSHQGDGQVLCIVGEPGVGKSRLCHEFAERCRARGIPIYEAQAQAHAKAVPLLPVLQLLRAFFAITADDTERQAREKVAGRLLLLDPGFAEDLPLIFDLLAVPDPERPAPRMDPEARQRQLLEIGTRVVEASSRHEPGINLFEDLHWIDPGSEIYLGNLVRSVAGTKNMTVVNFRPEYESDWLDLPNVTRIDLVPLDDAAIAELLDDLVGDDASLEPVRSLVRTRTSGNPFFVEEIVQSLIESDNLEGERGAYRLVGEVDEAAVPASVQALLAARIDRLEDRAKSLLQSASVIGKEFTRPVLKAISGLEEEQLDDALEALEAGELVYPQAIEPEAVYAFKHPLTQEVAHNSILSERRATIHGVVAKALAELYPERADEQAALIAQHWEQAGNDREASRWHARAAAWTGTSDPGASLEHWKRVREIVAEMPEDEETILLGINSRIWTLQFGWRLGMDEKEVEALYAEGEELARRSGDLRSRAGLMMVYSSIRAISGRIAVPQFIAESLEAMSLAEEADDDALVVGLTTAPVFALWNAGRYREAIKLAERAIELTKGDPTFGAGISIGSPLAFQTMWKAVCLTQLGELDEAISLLSKALEIARAQGDLETMDWCYEMRVWHAYCSGDSSTALADGKQCFEIGERIGDGFTRSWARYWLAAAYYLEEDWERCIELSEESERMSQEMGTAVLGRPPRLAQMALALSAVGRAEEGIPHAKEAIRSAEEQGVTTGLAFGLVALARCLRLARGEAAADEAAQLLDRAIESIKETEFRGYQPQVHEELAEIQRMRGDEDAYEAELRQALSIAEEIGASAHAARYAEALGASGAPAP